jgi:hypothetical protein
MEWEANGARKRQEEIAALLRQGLLRFLRERFQPDLPEEIVTAVSAQGEPAKLTGWFLVVAKAGSLADVRKALGLP